MTIRTRARVAGYFSKAGQFGSAAVFAFALSACSSLPEWTSPINWGDGQTNALAETPAEVLAAEAEVNAEAPAFPDIADMPELPEDLDTFEERQQKMEGLKAARAPRYTDEEPVGGPLGAAPEPAPVAPEAQLGPNFAAGDDPTALAPPLAETEEDVNLPDEPEAVAEADMMPGEVTQAPIAPTPAELPPATSVPADSSEDSPGPPGGTVETPEPLPQVTVEESPVTAPRMLEDLAGAEADTPSSLAYAETPPRALTFEPSKAPPLDPEALAYVPPEVARRYDETRMAASRPHDVFEGPRLPGVMTQPPPTQDSVRVDYGAIVGTAVGGPAVAPSALEQQVAVAPALRSGNAAVIYFGHNSSRLNDADRAVVAEVLRYQAQHGGTIRVIGHASSRTRDMPVEEHLKANYRVSVKRAEAVAKEFTRQGADPGILVVEAKGDSSPIYYESMPAGEAGNRRVEIFVE